MISDRIAWAKRSFIPVAAASALVVLPAAAQQAQPHAQMIPADPQLTADDNLKGIASSINQRRAELFRKKDPSGIAAVYTADATYVEVLPKLLVMQGRADIQRHFQDLLAAGAGNLVFTVTEAQITPSGAMQAGGDYYIVTRSGRKITGRFFQILRQDGGNWKIAMHVFARPEAVTPVEARQYNVSG
jgi:ketosteroid isomerase-like protein